MGELEGGLPILSVADGLWRVTLCLCQVGSHSSYSEEEAMLKAQSRELGTAAHACHTSPQKAKAGLPQVLGQPGLQNETLFKKKISKQNQRDQPTKTQYNSEVYSALDFKRRPRHRVVGST